MPTNRSRISLPSRKVYPAGLLDQQTRQRLQRNAGPRAIDRQRGFSVHTDPDKTSGDKPCLGSDCGPDDLRASSPLARASRGSHLPSVWKP